MVREKNDLIHLIVPRALGKNDPFRSGNDDPVKPGAERYSKNIYFYWHQFFRAYWDFHNKAEGPDAALIRRVKKDFSGALADDFQAWWGASGHLLFTNKYDDQTHAVPIRNARELRGYKNGLLVYLPFDGHFPDMIKEVRPLFEDAVEEYYLKKSKLRRKYELYSQRYDLTAIRNQLTVYRAVMSDIARNKGRATPFRRVFSDIHDSLILEASAETWGAEDETQFMHRNFKRACRLAFHVARGTFPNPNEPLVTYMPPRSSGHLDDHYLRKAEKTEEE